MTIAADQPAPGARRRLGAVRDWLAGSFTIPVPRRRKRAAAPAPAAELTGVLRAFRSAALWLIAALILAASGAAFAESYQGLYEWARHHGKSGTWASLYPLQIDVFIAVPELVLFIAMLDSWKGRHKVGAWVLAALGLAVSVAGNIGHVTDPDLQSRATAAVPPLAAFAALWLGFTVVKRILDRRQRVTETAAQSAQQAAERDVIAAALGSVADAVRALAERPAAEVPAAASRADETALLAELLTAVRDVGERVSGMSSVPVPVGAEHAALIAYRATMKAGNPYSLNALQVRFGLTRAQAEKVRAAIADEHGQAPADVNGHQLEAAGVQNGSSQ